VDYHLYYSTDEMLKQLQEKMAYELYPPRFRIGLKVKNKSFFSKQQGLEFELMGGNRDLKISVAIDDALIKWYVLFCIMVAYLSNAAFLEMLS